MGRRYQKNPGGLLQPLLDEPLWFPTSLLHEEIESKRAWKIGPFGLRMKFRPSEYFAMLARVQPDSWSRERHPTIAFIGEMARGVPPLETALYRSVLAGDVVSRHLGASGERAKVRIRGEDEFLQYARRVQNLLDLAARQGIQPISTRAAVDPNVSRGKEGDIGIAVVDKQVYFYRKGHHRFGAAVALGIERIPCQCYFLASGDRSIGDLDALKQQTILALKAMT